jgi:hypothetical protein
MKYVVAIGIAVILVVTAYFVINPGVRNSRPQPVSISPSNPFFSPKPVEIPYNTGKVDYARKLFADGKYAESVSVCGSLFSAEPSRQMKATLVLMAAQALVEMNDAGSRRYASELYQVYLEQFAAEGNLDTVRYNLGLLALNEANGPTALLHFTTLLQENPESRFAPNAAFSARQIAGVIEREHETPKGKILRWLGPLLPTNAAALAGILTSLATVLMWFLYDWKGHYERLIVNKDPVTWVLLLMFVGLAVTNYVMEDQQNAKSMLDATKALSSLRRR